MIFGMPTALFPVLALDVFKVGPVGFGLLAAAPGVGAFFGALLSGWVSSVRRVGRAVILAVIVWGLAITGFGLATFSFPLALLLIAIAGAADVLSAVFRSTILQLGTPDELRGRVTSIHLLVVTSGPRLGDLEATGVAAIFGAQFSVVSRAACSAWSGWASWPGPFPSCGGRPARSLAAQKVTTLRRPSPARSRSKAASTSSRPIRALDQALDRQASSQLQPGVAREVDRSDRKAVVAAEDRAAAVDEREHLEAGPDPERCHPDEDGGAARWQEPDRLVDRCRQADRLEREVRSGPASGSDLGLGRGRVGSGQDDVSRTELPGQLELGRHPVDGDDRIRPGQDRAHHGRQADAAEADHDDAGPGRHLGGLGHGADAGRHAAADQCRDLRRRARRASGSRQLAGTTIASASVPIPQYG